MASVETPDGSDGPLTVVSNRLPVTLRKTASGVQVVPSSGGLVAAMQPVLTARGGVWIGWSGTSGKNAPETLDADLPYSLVSVPMTEAEVNRHYLGFSNRCLWPLFHSLVPSAVFDRHDWDVYERVNERFAERTKAEAGADRLVWIHDYQLMRTPTHLRRRRPDARIAFFLHIPFPSPDVFRILPWAKKILRGLLACDLVGFHTSSYVRNFFDCVELLMGSRVDRTQGLVEHGDRLVRVGAFPLGIDFDAFEERARRAKRERGVPRRFLLGVDRLDYTKGIPERLRAFERLLASYPEHREHVTLVQLAVPSRSQVSEYRRLKREVDETVGRINGRFASARWVPIRYLHRSLSWDRLASLYRYADVALVTPLRDGMNLVAKEYVASQVDDPGVLVLSSLAGAAEAMPEALLVNPYDEEGSAAAFHRALTMREAERRSRMVALRERERRRNVHAWVESFLEVAVHRPDPETPLVTGGIEAWLGNLLGRQHLVLLLAFDGTLARLEEHPDDVVLQDDMRAALRGCLARPDTSVAIVSGRRIDDLRGRIGEEGLIYAGNHGLRIVGPGVETFEHPDLAEHADEIGRIIEDLTARARGGAWVEAKGPTATLHLRDVGPENRKRLADMAHERAGRSGFLTRDAVDAIEILPPIPWDKGSAVLYILRSLHGPDWPVRARAFYAGDDETDEDAFSALSGLGLTVRIGSASGRTSAARLLPDPAALKDLLLWFAERPQA